MIMMDICMVGIWQWTFPYHHYIFPPGGNMAGGNLMVGHDNSDEDSEYSGDGYHDHGDVALC